MYLHKAPNGNYFTRICIPQTLRSSNYPFDIKVSLLTKERPLAIERNFIVASKIKQLLNQINPKFPPLYQSFKWTLDEQIQEIREQFNNYLN